MRFYIYVTRTDLDGYKTEVGVVGYDNDVTDCYESYLFFDTVESAYDWISKEGKDWKGCEFEVLKDE